MYKHEVYFHGDLVERYGKDDIRITAESMTALLRILFKNIYPDFLRYEKSFTIVIEDSLGNCTEIFDPEQQLPTGNCRVHILPNPDGAEILTIIAIVLAIISIGAAFLLAPKVDAGSEKSASGAVWSSPDNIIGQGGVTPVLLGRRLVGSRVVSHGIDSQLYVG